MWNLLRNNVFLLTEYEYSLGKMMFYAIWWSRNGIGYYGWDTGAVKIGANWNQWKDISQGRGPFLSCNRFVVGNGGWVGFLKDLWVVQKTLRSLFPNYLHCQDAEIQTFSGLYFGYFSVSLGLWFLENSNHAEVEEL